jgi:Growth inhibitor
MADLNLDNFQTSLQQGVRPVLVVQCNAANNSSSNITIIPLTAKNKKMIPAHVSISGCGLKQPSILLAEQITTQDKSVLHFRLGSVKCSFIKSSIQNAINHHFGKMFDRFAEM